MQHLKYNQLYISITSRCNNFFFWHHDKICTWIAEQLQRLVNERTTQFPTDPHDEEILRRERDQPIRGTQEVYRDIEYQARSGRFTASLAFLDACEGANFLSPQASNEGVGLPVTLARVESEDLNQWVTFQLLHMICKLEIWCLERLFNLRACLGALCWSLTFPSWMKLLGPLFQFQKLLENYTI